jgi:hypothetical protein
VISGQGKKRSVVSFQGSRDKLVAEKTHPGGKAKIPRTRMVCFALDKRALVGDPFFGNEVSQVSDPA